MHNGGMIKIGSLIQVGIKTLVVDDICPETGNLFCLDNDGEEFEVTQTQVLMGFWSPPTEE